MKHQITQVTQSLYSPNLVPCDFWLFRKLKSPLKGKKFQTISETQENTTGQLMAIGRTVGGPRMPTLKGTEVSLSCVQCFFYLCIFNKYLYFSYYMAGYLLDRPHLLENNGVSMLNFLNEISILWSCGRKLLVLEEICRILVKCHICR